MFWDFQCYSTKLGTQNGRIYRERTLQQCRSPHMFLLSKVLEKLDQVTMTWKKYGLILAEITSQIIYENSFSAKYWINFSCTETLSGHISNLQLKVLVNKLVTCMNATSDLKHRFCLTLYFVFDQIDPKLLP